MWRAVLAFFLLVAVFATVGAGPQARADASSRAGGSEPPTAAGIKAVYELVYQSHVAELRARGEVGNANGTAREAALRAKTFLDTALGDLGGYGLSADNPTANLQAAANDDEEVAHLLAAPQPDPLDEATAKAKLTEGLTNKAVGMGLLVKLEKSLAAVGSGQPPSSTGSDQCQASPGGSCTFTPVGKQASLSAPGAGIVQVENPTTGQTTSYAAPTTFTINVIPGHVLELINKSNQSATITGTPMTTPTATPSTPGTLTSCIDVRTSGAGQVAALNVTDPLAPHKPVTVTITAPGFDKKITLTLDSAGSGASEAPVPTTSYLGVLVQVTPSPTLPPQSETFTALEDGKAHCTSTNTTPSTSTAPASNAPTSTATPSAGEVIIAHHELGWAQTTNICSGGTLLLTLTLDDIPANTQVKLNLTGNGLPSSLTLTLDPGFQVTRDFTLPPSQGTVTWTSQIVSIGGKPAPTSGAHASAFANCPTTT
jgi:hypothetical protein